jgi:rhamnose utilization protein RhaD (predicted bifunctional aldolase and dehydrogenase)
MAELGLDGSGFNAGFHKARGLAQGVAEGIKGFVIQAVGIVTVEEAMRRTVETAKELVEASERLAISPENLQVMRKAAKDSNLEFEALVRTMEKLSIAREKALIPGKEGLDARRAFSTMGIRTPELQGMTNKDLLMGPIRDAVLKSNPEQLGIIFRELGIKSFGPLTNFLRKDFDALQAKMESLRNPRL